MGIKSIPPPPAPPIVASNQFPRSKWTNHPRSKGHNTQQHPHHPDSSDSSTGSSSPLRRNVHHPHSPDSLDDRFGEDGEEDVYGGGRRIGAGKAESLPFFYVVGYGEGDSHHHSATNAASTGEKGPSLSLLTVSMLLVVGLAATMAAGDGGENRRRHGR